MRPGVIHLEGQTVPVLLPQTGLESVVGTCCRVSELFNVAEARISNGIKSVNGRELTGRS